MVVVAVGVGGVMAVVLELGAVTGVVGGLVVLLLLLLLLLVAVVVAVVVGQYIIVSGVCNVS